MINGIRFIRRAEWAAKRIPRGFSLNREFRFEKECIAYLYARFRLVTYRKAKVHSFDERSRRPEISHFITSALSNVPISSLRFGVIIITI